MSEFGFHICSAICVSSCCNDPYIYKDDTENRIRGAMSRIHSNYKSRDNPRAFSASSCLISLCFLRC